MKTAGLSFEEMQAAGDEAALHDWTEWFFERYAPKDPYDRHRFHADLFSLIQRTYCMAQAPLLEHLAKMAALATPSLFPGAGGRSGETSAVYGPPSKGDNE